jgi:SAM-dependent MidA family methyltransferase
MNPLALQIRREMEKDGPVSFARFMELALYAPELGYYERQREVGRRGDFFTSVSVGPMFGELLAFQFAQWMDEHSPAEKWQIIEAGAHRGDLAADVLGWLQRRRADLFARLEYGLVEPSATRRSWQAKTLGPWQSQVKWLDDISDAGQSASYRIIFSNEFLDAMPAHRFSWNAKEKQWRELLVGFENDRFVWMQANAPADAVNNLPKIGSDLAAILPDGFMVEHSPAAVAWWKKAAGSLGRGKLLTIDYGLTSDEWLRPERSHGTLRTYAQHHPGGDPLEKPGECDITAHVNFSAVEDAGRAVGLVTETFTGQDKFLTQVLAQTEAKPGSFDPWTAARTRQFQTLTHPEHLGHAFRVLVQSRQT